MDDFRQKPQSRAIAMNDAKGCFDRINHTFTILVLMSFGVSAVLARSLFETLQKADHHIKTGYDGSDKAYGNNNEPEPHQGIGKGNGLGPTLWALLSLILIKNMKQHNRTPAMMPLAAPLLGLYYSEGYISLRKWTYRPLLRESTTLFKSTCFLINRIQAMVPLTAPLFGVILRGHISLKNRTYCPLLRESASLLKSTCLLITLK
jgi:hypothetical protein